MSMKKSLLSAVGLLVLAIGIQLPGRAQSLSENDLAAGGDTYEVPLSESVRSEPAAAELGVQAGVLPEESLTAETLTTEAMMAEPAADTELVYPVSESEEVAQVRRRQVPGAVASPDFIGIGADFGTADDVTFAVISKLSVRPQIAVRPSVLVGNDFAVLVPVTYQFNRFNTNAAGFQISPYAGLGASYVDGDDSSDIGLLLSGGVDVPVSRQFTVNAQANYAGIFSDSENFGVTVGVGYNFGGLLR